MSWTPEQLEAITLRDKNILVSASAGSGKTAVLVERILALVAEGFVPLSEFLIVTFTNAAAQEMRERISKRLVALKKERPQERIFIGEQLQKVQQAHISTLHSFCKDVIAKHFYLLDIDPNFRIGSQQILDLKQQEALEWVLETHYKENQPAFSDLMSIFSSHRGDEPIKQLILHLYQFSRAHPYPQQWLDSCVANYQAIDGNFDHTPLASAIKSKVGQVLAALTAQLEAALALCQLPEGPRAYGESLQEDLASFAQGRTLTAESSWAHFDEAIAQISFERLKTIKKADKDLVDPELADEIKAIRDQVKKGVESLKKLYFFEPIDSALEAMGQMEVHLYGLTQLVNQFADRYWVLKQEEQLVDFNDLEQLCIAALNYPEVAEVYKRQFRYVFVDEYQDTNRVQEEIVGLLKRQNNLFQVGDVKQSIYRFRMAEPELFLSRFYSYPEDSMAKRVDLNRNFRTHPHILKGVNHIFDHLLTEAFGGLSYEREGRLVPGREDFVGACEPHIHLIAAAGTGSGVSGDNSGDAADMDSGDAYESDANQSADYILEGTGYESEGLEGRENLDSRDGQLTVDPEAQAIYQRIVSLLQTEFYDAHQKVNRNYQLGDMVVLMRSIKGRSQQLRDFLAVKGIPVSIDEEDSYFDIVEVANVLNCLRILDNQYQDIPLLGVMRSAIGNFTDAELASIRTWHPKSFHQAMKAYIGVEDQETSQELSQDLSQEMSQLKQELRAKVQAFEALLVTLREKSHLPASEFLWHVLSTTGYWYYVIGLEDGHYRRQHLEVLMEKARQFELEQQSGLHHFVEYLDQLQRARVSYGGKANDKTDVAAVRIMSIHKSKGLEFPVVLLVGASKRFNLQDTRARLVMHQKLGLGVKWMHPHTRQSKDTLPLSHLKGIITEDSVMEEVRILYVALTRAVNRLEVFATVKDFEKSSKRWRSVTTPYQYAQQRSYVDWLMSALVVGVDFQIQEGPCLLNGWVVHQRGNVEAAQREDTSDHMAKTLWEQFQSANAKTWPEATKVVDAMPAKLSVTELKQHGQKLVYVPRISALSNDFEPIQEGILRGNAYHAFAEHMPLDHTPSHQVFEQLLASGRLTPEQGDLIDTHQLIALRESPWFERVINAQRVWREHPFVWRKSVNPQEYTLIQGVVDLLFLEQDGLVLLDYKSDRLFKADDYIQRYERQLSLYREAIEVLLKMPVKETVIYSFTMGEWIQVAHH